MTALRLCEDILTSVGVSSPSLLEVLLDGTFTEVLQHLTWLLSPEDSSSSVPGIKKRLSDLPLVVKRKRERRAAETKQKEDEKEDKHTVKVVRRGGEVMDIKNTEGTKSSQKDKLRGQNINKGVRLSLRWSSDTGRCVDASPVLLIRERANQRPDEAEASVFIGSHSHMMQAVDLLTGNLLWERVLGDRIEASAAVSRCGTLVVVG